MAAPIRSLWSGSDSTNDGRPARLNMELCFACFRLAQHARRWGLFVGDLHRDGLRQTEDQSPVGRNPDIFVNLGHPAGRNSDRG